MTEQHNKPYRYEKHGMWGTRLYKVWVDMRRRVKSTIPKRAKSYLNKGVKVCKEWDDNFISFYTWAMDNGYSEGLSIDREDNDGDYSPDNCRWATGTTQMRNTRKIYAHNKSGFRGVSFEKNTNKWVATVGVNGKTKKVGRFLTVLQAAFRRDKYVLDNNLGHTLNFNWG